MTDLKKLISPIWPRARAEFKRINYLLFPFRSSENCRFSDISKGIEVNGFSWIWLILEAKFGNKPCEF